MSNIRASISPCKYGLLQRREGWRVNFQTCWNTERDIWITDHLCQYNKDFKTKKDAIDWANSIMNRIKTDLREAADQEKYIQENTIYIS